MDGKELLEQLASGELRLSAERMTPDLADTAHMDSIVRSVAESIAMGARVATNGEGKRTAVSVPLLMLPEMAGAALKVWLAGCDGCDQAIDAAIARVLAPEHCIAKD